ncbi:MAG TPA: glycosyltransferase, partial [Fibrobacteria bacterium]|nr:glycosyltransferase [Fibrobacteria bacterium]
LQIDGRWEGKLFRFPPFRWNPALRVWLRHEVFDRAVARKLVPCDTFVAFMGAGRHSFRRARELGVRRLVLEMPNSHPANVRSLHAKATSMHPFERSWMNSWFQSKVESELAMADEIRANSDYTARSVVERGTPASKVARRHLGWHPRFSGIERKPHPEGLRTIVMVGSLTVFKGVPFLVDIFRRLDGTDLRLLLVGGWTDRAMRLYLEDARRIDPRISWTSGDPAPHLETASLAVHPSWEDGWGYAPAEALASGVPLLVSDQTGMMELRTGGAMRVLPVGDVPAWTGALVRWARGDA